MAYTTGFYKTWHDFEPLCEKMELLPIGYTDSMIPLLLISRISSFELSSVTVDTGMCQTWLEILKTGFLVMCDTRKSVFLVSFTSDTNRPVQS